MYTSSAPDVRLLISELDSSSHRVRFKVLIILTAQLFATDLNYTRSDYSASPSEKRRETILNQPSQAESNAKIYT